MARWRVNKLQFSSIVILLLSTALPVFGQQQPPPDRQAPPSNPSATQQSQPGDTNTQDDSKKGQEETTGTSKDRLFFALPNFLTLENVGQPPPLTTGQKFKVVARGSFDYVEYPWYGLLAGLNQAENSDPGYGQGAQGYAKRYGSNFANGTIENFMTGAVFPSLLREDPRYFQSGKGKFFHRAGYAVSRIFVTRTDSGHNQFNYSELAGSGVAAGISNIYSPVGDRTFSNTMSVWATQIVLDAMTIELKEFWPDIRHKLFKK